jgi:DHA1 family multidrug resistance protein-like MFS transporter
VAVFGAALAYFPQGLVENSRQLLALRSILGIFNAATGPAVFALVACLVPARQQGGAFGLTSTPLMLGNLVGPIAGGVLQAALGIRSVFFITGTLLLIVGVAAGLLVKDPVNARTGRAETSLAG